MASWKDPNDVWKVGKSMILWAFVIVAICVFAWPIVESLSDLVIALCNKGIKALTP